MPKTTTPQYLIAWADGSMSPPLPKSSAYRVLKRVTALNPRFGQKSAILRYCEVVAR